MARQPKERVMTAEELLSEQAGRIQVQNGRLAEQSETITILREDLAACRLQLGKRDERILTLERDNKAIEQERERLMTLAASRLSDLERLRQDHARALGYIDRVHEEHGDDVEEPEPVRPVRRRPGPKLSMTPGEWNGLSNADDHQRVYGWGRK